MARRTDISLILTSAALLTGCASASEAKTWQQMSRPDRLATLNGIAEQCHLSHEVFELRAGDRLRFKPNPSAKYEDVDCALGKLKTIRGSIDLGFVGNESYGNESQ